MRAKRRKCAVVSASPSQFQLSERLRPSCVRMMGVNAPSSHQRSQSSLVLGPPLKPAMSCVTKGMPVSPRLIMRRHHRGQAVAGQEVGLLVADPHDLRHALLARPARAREHGPVAVGALILEDLAREPVPLGGEGVVRQHGVAPVLSTASVGAHSPKSAIQPSMP
jgi:hypothetical protein